MAGNDTYTDPLAALRQGLQQANQPSSSLDYFAAEKARLAKDLDKVKQGLATTLENRKRNENSLVSELFLDPQSVAGRIVNTGASLVSGVANIAGTVAAVPEYLAALPGLTLPDESYRAYERHKAGKATAEDLKLLNEGGGDSSPLAKIESGIASVKGANGTRKAFDLSDWVHSGNRQATDKELDAALEAPLAQISKGWNALKNYDEANGWADITSGLATALAKGANVLANNPMTVTEMVAENGPQTVLGGLGKAGVTVLGTFGFGYALETFNKGIEEYKKANGGKMPTEAERVEIGTLAVTAALADYATDVKLGKGVADSVESALAGGAKKNLDEILFKGTKDLGSASAMEGVTEGYQTYAEEAAGLGNVDPAKVLKGALYGAAVGGATRGSGTALEATVAALPEPGKRTQTSDQLEVGPSEKFTAAVSARDPGMLLASGQPTDAADAVRAASHLLLNEKNATAQDKQAWTKVAESGVSVLEDTLKTLQTLADPAQRAAAEKNLKGAKELAKQLPGDPEVEALLAGAQASMDKFDKAAADPQALQAQMDQAIKTLDSVRTVFDNTVTASAPAKIAPPADLAQAVALANQDLTNADEATKAQAQSAAQSLVLSMLSENPISAKDAKALAANVKNGLSQEFRNYFEAFAEAMVEVGRVKDMKTVSQEILYGNTKDIGKGRIATKGVMQYQAAIGKFLAAGNKAGAQRELAGLRKFASAQQTKVSAISSAFKKASNEGGQYQVVKENGAWTVAPMSMSKEALAKAGGLLIHRNSNNSGFVTEAIAGAKAVIAAAKAMKLAVDLPLDAKEQSPQENKPAKKAKAAKAKPVLSETEKTAQALEKLRRKVARKNPASLYSAVKHKLNDSDLGDIYGSEWRKRYTALKGKESLVDLVTSGELDAFLPPNLRFATGLESDLAKEQEAVEYIKEKLRNRDYLTEDTKQQLAQLNYTLDQLDQATTEQGLTDAIERTAAELESTESTEPTDGAASSERVAEVATESTDGSVAEPDATQDGAEAPADDVTTETAQEEKTNGVLDSLKDQASFLFGRIKQSLRSEGAVTQNPLVAVKDFLSAWKNGETSPAKFLKTELTEKQEAALEAFKSFADEVSAGLATFLDSSEGAKYARKNPAEFLMTYQDGKPDFPENVKTAMAAAIMSWVADSMREGIFNDKKAMNSILGVNEETPISDLTYKLLGTKVTRRNIVVNDLGKAIGQALGLKATSKAEKSLMPRIESTLGAYALEYMRRNGLVDLVTITPAQFNTMAESDATTENQLFIRLALNKNGTEHSIAATDVGTPLIGAQGVLDKLFTVEAGMRAPSFEVPDFKQKLAKGSKMLVPNWLNKALNTEAKNAYEMDMDGFNMLASMDEDAVVMLQGAYEGILDNQHKANRKSAQAKKDGLLREWRNLVEFVGNDLVASAEGVKSKFYFTPSVWKNQRVGIANNMVNPQSSKIHRGLMFQGAWQTQVDPANTKQMDAFKLRVLEKFGVKIDQMTGEDALAKWSEVTGKPEIQAAISAVQKWNSTKEMTPEMQQAIVEGVKAGGEGMSSFTAIKALAAMADANGKPFTSTLTAEVDGVANGPMLSLLLLGAAPAGMALKDILKLGGFFQQGDNNQNYNVFRGSPGVQDLYETAAKSLLDVLGKAPESAARTAVWSFLGELTKNGKISKDGRKLVKTPITALTFGSSMETATGNMVNDLISGIYSAIEGIDNDAKRLAVINGVNAFLPSKLQWPTSTTRDWMMEHVLTGKEVKAIQSSFHDALGGYMAQALEPLFGTLTERRSAITSLTNQSFSLYNGVRSVLRAQYMQHLVESKQVPLNSDDTATWDLSAEQEAKLDSILKGLLPVVHSVMSKDDGKLDAGLLMANQETRLSKSSLYSSTPRFKKRAGDKDSTSTIGVNSQESTLGDPGVLGLPTMAHSFDSKVSHFASDTKSLNVHDARIAGFGQALDVARKMNEGVFRGAIGFNPVQEAYEGYERSILGLVALLGTKDKDAVEGETPRMVRALAPTVIAYLDELARTTKTNKKLSRNDYLKQGLINYLVAAKQQAYQASKERLTFLANASHIDQYAAEGGQYTLTDADRAAAAKALTELEAEGMSVSPQTLAKVDELVKLATSVKKNDAMVPAAVFEYVEENNGLTFADLDMAEGPATRLLEVLASMNQVPAGIKAAINEVQESLWAGQSLSEALTDSPAHQELISYMKSKRATGIIGPYGVLAKPRVAPVKALVDLFEAKPEMSGKELARELVKYLGQFPQGHVGQAYASMVKMAFKAMGDDVKVVYVTPTTDKAKVERLPKAASRGWYDPNNKTLFVLSPDHADSGLDSEMLVHELTHAALQAIIDNPQTPAQKQIVAELNRLLDKAREVMADRQEQAVREGLSNIHEFIAYGMTNPTFQKALGGIRVETTKGTSELISLFQDLLTKLTSLLFGKPGMGHKDATVDVFSALVANVTGMYVLASEGAAAKTKEAVTQSLLSMASPTDAILDFTTEQVAQALPAPGVSLQFQEKLDSLLTSVVNKLHGPFGAIKTQIQAKVGKTPLEAWSHALATGQRPFASKALNSGVVFSQREAFVTEQVEATVRAMLEDRSSSESLVYRELNNLFLQAKAALKGKIDADTYNYVFLSQTTGSNNRSDYLSKFIALGLANENFNKALEFQTRGFSSSSRGMTFMERVEQAWKDSIDWVAARWTGTYMGQQGNAKLQKLVTELMQVEARYKVQIPGVNIAHDFLERLSASGDTFMAGAKTKVAEAAESNFVKNNPFKIVRLAGAVTSITARGRVESVMATIAKIRNQNQDSADGLIMGTVNYMAGIGQWATQLLMATKRIEQQRKAIATDTAKIIMDSFKDGGAYLDKQARAGVTYTFVRSGAHALMDRFTMQDIQAMLDDPKQLKAAIDQHKHALTKFPEALFYAEQAEGLGFFLATNRVGVQDQQTNATAISRLYGTGRKVPEYAEDAKPVIERLAALVAIHELGQESWGREYRNAAAEVLRTENQRGEANGIEMVMLTHKHLEADARERLFANGNESLMIQGHLPEISNPHTEFEVIRDPDEASALIDRGYEYVHDVAIDDIDPDRRPAKMYVLRGGGLGRRQSGVFSLTDIGAKGASKHNKYYNPLDPDGIANMQSMMDIRVQVTPTPTANRLPHSGFSPRKQANANNYMLPLMNSTGQIVDYRYVMSARNRDTMLERDNRFDHLLGVQAGATFDKVESPKQNRKALQALKEHYNQNFSHSSADFIHIAHTSTDKRMREIWDMLPAATKQDVQAVWGNNGLWVPKNMVDVMFGYRKYSLAEAFEKEHPNVIEKFFARGITALLYEYARYGKKLDEAGARNYAKRAAIITRRAEDVWKELVRETKDFIVVKTGTVLYGNMVSNLMMLMGKDVPLIPAMKDMFVAWRAAIDYDRDSHALRKLELLVASGYGSKSMDEVQAEIARLRDALSRNPVGELVEAGMKPTIVEDLNMEEDQYSYKSQLTQWVESKTDRLSPGIKNVGRFMYMTHDTTVYQFLSKATQYSDFVARYAMYKHLTERAKVKMSKADAIHEASEAFVMYDVPMPKTLQYLDETNVLPFIKYSLSIQRVLAKMFKDKPLAALNMVLMADVLGNLPVPTDSSYINRFGSNPVGAGAFGLPSDMMQAATMQAAVNLVK